MNTVRFGYFSLVQFRLGWVGYLAFRDKEEDELLQIVASAVAVVVVAAAVAVVVDGGDDGWPGRLRDWTSAMREPEMTDLPKNWIYRRAQETICQRKIKKVFFELKISREVRK